MRSEVHSDSRNYFLVNVLLILLFINQRPAKLLIPTVWNVGLLLWLLFTDTELHFPDSGLYVSKEIDHEQLLLCLLLYMPSITYKHPLYLKSKDAEDCINIIRNLEDRNTHLIHNVTAYWQSHYKLLSDVCYLTYSTLNTLDFLSISQMNHLCTHTCLSYNPWYRLQEPILASFTPCSHQKSCQCGRLISLSMFARHLSMFLCL